MARYVLAGYVTDPVIADRWSIPTREEITDPPTYGAAYYHATNGHAANQTIFVYSRRTSQVFTHAFEIRAASLATLLPLSTDIFDPISGTTRLLTATAYFDDTYNHIATRVYSKPLYQIITPAGIT